MLGAAQAPVTELMPGARPNGESHEHCDAARAFFSRVAAERLTSPSPARSRACNAPLAGMHARFDIPSLVV